MAIVTSSALIDALRQYRLLTPDQLAQLVQRTPARGQDVRQMAKSLIQRGWLTVYQINQLLSGYVHQLVFGPYHILDRLGSGGQSQVFKARHYEYNWTVALKVFRVEALETPEARLQFLQEMEAMARMDHPNVVQFCDVDQVGETFYCAMEHVEGTDLGKWVRLEGMLPPARASDCMRQAALGLQHAFEHNLVHRDIKPVNLLLTNPPPVRGASKTPSGGLVKILDWGLACLRLPGERPPARTSATGILGTADYLSPEQARDAQAADIRSDIYSLGCTFYYLLTAQVPFSGGTLVEKLMQHQNAEAPPLESFNPAVMPGLSAVVRRMMAKKPEDRFQTPAAAAVALAPFCRNEQLVPANALASAASSRTGHNTPVPPVLRPRLPAAPGRTDIPTRVSQDTPRSSDTFHR